MRRPIYSVWAFSTSMAGSQLLMISVCSSSGEGEGAGSDEIKQAPMQ